MSPIVASPAGRAWHPGRIPDLFVNILPRNIGVALAATVQSATDFSPFGRHATQATSTARPVLKANAINGFPSLQYTVTNSKYSRTAGFGPIAQPTTIFWVAKVTQTAKFVMSGIDTTNNQAISVSAAGLWQINAGTAMPGRTNDTSAFVVGTAVFNGASSRIRINGSETTGNAGTNALGGITLSSNAGLSIFGDTEIAWLFGYSRLLTDAEIARCEREMRAMVGLPDWSVTHPARFGAYQRPLSGSGTTDLTIEGTYTSLPTGIEVRYKGGAWTDIGATFAAGNWSGTLPAQTDGQGTLEVRRADTPTDVVSILYVAVTDCLGWIGQSNQGGHLDNDQAYSHATLKPGLMKKGATAPAEMLDPTNSLVTHGSHLPDFATLYMAAHSVPPFAIACAVGGTGLVTPQDWERNDSNYTDFIAAVRNSRVKGLRWIDWYQGEDDAKGGTSRVAYAAAVPRLFDRIKVDLGPSLPLNLTSIASDAFTAADGTTLDGRTPDSGTAWTVRSGTIQIVGNKATPIAPLVADPGSIATMELSEAKAHIECTINRGDGAAVGVVVRYNPADGTHYLCAPQASSLSIYQWNGTAYVQVASTTHTFATNTDYAVVVDVAGDYIGIRADGVEAVYSSATANQAYAHYGLRFSPTVLSGSIDGWSASGYRMKLFVTQLSYTTWNGTTRGELNAVRLGQQDAWENESDIFQGAILNDLGPFADTVHITSDADSLTVAQRKSRAIDHEIHATTNGSAPELLSLTQVDSTHIDVAFTLDGTTTLVLGASPTIGWRVMDSGVQRTVTSVALQNATTLRLTLGAACTGTVLVSFASYNDNAGGTITDDGTYPLPPLGFIDEEVP